MENEAPPAPAAARRPSVRCGVRWRRAGRRAGAAADNPPPQDDAKAAAEAAAEAALRARYGGALPQRAPLTARGTFFDSADWALRRAGAGPAAAPSPAAARLAPAWAAPPRGVAGDSVRRASHLGE